MIIGNLKNRIGLQSPTDTDDGSGGYNTAYVSAGSAWAEIKTPRAATINAAGGIASELMREVKIRYRPAVQVGWRVTLGGSTYEVMHTYPVDRDWTIMLCKELQR